MNAVYLSVLFCYWTMPKKSGVCAYCQKFVARLTKEHVVPRCVGGRMKIRVCATCNNARGCKLDDPRFVAWRHNNPEVFKQAILTSADQKQTLNWLNYHGKKQPKRAAASKRKIQAKRQEVRVQKEARTAQKACRNRRCAPHDHQRKNGTQEKKQRQSNQNQQKKATETPGRDKSIWRRAVRGVQRRKI